jgi:thiol:disulfide interchange protein DsbD
MFKVLFGILLGLIISLAHAGETRPLPLEEAFHFSAFLQHDNELTVQWEMARGYYLYRQQLSFTTSPISQVKLGKIKLPRGQIKQDVLHGTYQSYTGTLRVLLPLIAGNKQQLNLDISYQGCSASGFCYAMAHKKLDINLKELQPPQDITSYFVTAGYGEKKSIFAKYNNSIWFIVISFLGLGLLLAFTPCVLPMVPILSAIIVGHHSYHHSKRQQRISIRKSFGLSFMYVLGMAITYAIAGMLVALLGSRIQAELQKPWIIMLFSALFILLGVLLLGWYELHLPQHWRHRLNVLANRWKGGTYFGVFMMGGFSSLIVSPCVSAPLVGALAYIAQTGNIWVGGLALLALGFGMGIPLLLVGLSAGALLPKAGKWMLAIERIFGILMLGMAIWMLSRILPGPVILFLWGALLILVSIELGLLSRAIRSFSSVRRTLEILIFIYGLILIVSSVFGNTSPAFWKEWKIAIYPVSKEEQAQHFVTIKSIDQLEFAKAQKKPILLDFYADWCVSCVTMEKELWKNFVVMHALSDFILLRADVTENNNFDQALMNKFNVIAPPTILFFDRNGQEELKYRIEGEINVQDFLDQLAKMGEMKRESN